MKILTVTEMRFQLHRHHTSDIVSHEHRPPRSGPGPGEAEILFHRRVSLLTRIQKLGVVEMSMLSLPSDLNTAMVFHLTVRGYYLYTQTALTHIPRALLY